MSKKAEGYISSMRKQICRLGYITPLIAAIVVAGYFVRPTLYSLHQRWTQWDGPYSHGYLLVIVCLSMIAGRLPGLVRGRVVQWRYIPLCIGPALIWSFGYTTQINAISQISIPLMIMTLLLPWIGLRGASRLLPALFLLFLAIPVWEVLLPILRTITTHAASMAVKSVQIPAYIDGYSFSLPAGTVVIAGSCAGLSYFLMGLVLSCLNAMHRRLGKKDAILSICLLVGLSILGNWIRVISLILIAYYSNMESPLVEEHGQFGWWIFAALFILFLLLTRSMPERPAKNETDVSMSWLMSMSPAALVISVALTVSIPFILQNRTIANADYRMVSDSTLTPETSGKLLGDLNIGFQGFDQAEVFTLNKNGRDWVVGRLVYTAQAQGKELVSDINVLTTSPTDILAPVMTKYGETQVEQSKDKQPKLLMWQYLVGQTHASKSWNAKLSQFFETLKGRPVVALWFAMIECGDQSCDEELKSLASGDIPLDYLIDAMRLYDQSGD
ncbi:MAG: exosortase [Reinekea sp.]